MDRVPVRMERVAPPEKRVVLSTERVAPPDKRVVLSTERVARPEKRVAQPPTPSASRHLELLGRRLLAPVYPAGW